MYFESRKDSYDFFVTYDPLIPNADSFVTIGNL